jgi:DNA-binding GntR family transcriptional regulator
MRTKKTHPAKPERGVSASKRVEAHLRHAIHAGKLRPRQRIIEEDLAHELKVSRGPVREALLPGTRRLGCHYFEARHLYPRYFTG